MRTARRVAVAATLGAALLPASALAADGSIKDERASGSLYPASAYARCDIVSMSAEKTRRTLLVTLVMRGPSTFGSPAGLHVNTKGGPTSDPEFRIGQDGVVTDAKFKSRGSAGVALTKRGKVVSFSVPLALLGKPKRVAVQAQTCGEGAVDIAPGAHYFDDRTYDGTIAHRYLTAASADRTISGRVALECSGKKSCRRLWVKGAAITAKAGKRTFTGVSDEKGYYELAVKRGLYTVGAQSDSLRITTKPKRVDVKQRKSGRADFAACGLMPRAAASQVTGGVWRGGNRDCLNYLEVAWRPSTGVSISWVSIPVCSAVGGNYTGEARALLRGSALNPAQQGANLVVKPDQIGFFYPIVSAHSGNNVNGTLRANGTGIVNARYVEGLCTYQIAKLPLKRG